MKTIELTAIDLEAERRAAQAQHEGSDYDTPAVELDDLERPVAPAATEPVEVPTYPVMVLVDALRSFYPRKQGKPGCRLVYHNGAAEIVKETYDEVKAKFNSLNN